MGGNNIIPYRRLLERRRARHRESTGWLRPYRRLWESSLAYLQRLKQGETPMDDLKIEAPAAEPVVIMTRTLNAPRELVWKALSEPEHVAAWWGPHGHKNQVLEFDWRVGGKWRIESTMPDGGVIVLFGEHREIDKPGKVTQTFSFDQLPEGAHSVDTVILEDHSDTIVYRAISTLPDLASRDGMIASGMETRVRQGFERLDAMLEEWKEGVRQSHLQQGRS